MGFLKTSVIRNLLRATCVALVMACGCLSVKAAQGGDCLSYEPAPVTLTGKVTRKVFPGPPNYESVKAGDEPEVAWLLQLSKPVCVKADGKDEFNVAVERVAVIHLVLQGKQFSQLRRLERKGAVTLGGTLFHSFTGHHHAEVLMSVKSMKSK
jgi:hypothetical protein